MGFSESPHKPQVILHEVSESVTDIESEIKSILQLCSGSQDSDENVKLELLIDGGVFAKMLLEKADVLDQLNAALNRASAVIIYRASPKQKE